MKSALKAFEAQLDAIREAGTWREERIITTFEKREAVDSFAVVPSYDEMEEKGYSFSAGQYFDVKIEHVDITPEEFKQKMSAFMAEFNELSAQSAKLDAEIRNQMSFLEFTQPEN